MEAISRVGKLGLASSMSAASKILFLIAQDANGYPGIYHSFKTNNLRSMKAWTDLTDQLRDHDKNVLLACANPMLFRSKKERVGTP